MAPSAQTYPAFYLFGMGPRRKLFYRAGALRDAYTGEVLRAWNCRTECIEPAEYRVSMETGNGTVVLYEDETGMWIDDNGVVEQLSAGQLTLPRFEGHPWAATLRQLHHELLINIVNGRPLPNLWVYRKPWYRDAAMTALVLKRTGNIDLLRQWILGLDEPFDRNNAGHCEPDNLGQALFLVSCVTDASHPLVSRVLKAANDHKVGRHLSGLSDFCEHPVYQTKWIKFGLAALGLPDAYEIPRVYDSYSCLFWMGYHQQHVDGPAFSDRDKALYPYLAWAEAHFHSWPPPSISGEDTYPLTWEAEASQAAYALIAGIQPDWAAARICRPHAWHAAEMFLYLLERNQCW